jgi:hypothetical protein
VLQAQLSRGYDLSDGALALRGNASRVNLVGGAAFISGIDHDPLNGNSLPETKSRNAVTFSDDALKDLFLQALGNPAPLGVLESATDVPAITSSSYLPASAIAQFANDLCAAPGVSLHPVPAGGNVTFENQVWGSQLSPQLHCVEGAVGSGDTATFAGSVSGSGILVVKEADMILTDTFRWEGWVIVTGQEVGLKASGSSIKEVLGAVLVNETGSPGSSTAILDIQGNLRLLFSRTTLRRSAQLIPNTTLTSNYAALPTFVVQDYWRAVNP